MKRIIAMLALCALATGCSVTAAQLRTVATTTVQLGKDMAESLPALIEDGKNVVKAVTNKPEDTAK